MKKRISRVLVTGANGAVASDLVPILIQHGFKVLATDIDCPPDSPFPIEYMDIRNPRQIKKAVKRFSPQCIAHLAAETDVEYCEINPKHAYETNTLGTKNIATLCARGNITLLYMSSVGTFDGKKKGPYNENDKQNPINVYGKTKYQGEKYVKNLLRGYFILRAGWMIGGGEKDKKFVAKILRLIRKGVRQLEVVTDKIGTPTYTADLSEIIARIIRTDSYGIYHVATIGNPSRFEIAKRILKKLKREDIVLKAVKSKDLKKIFFAPRPDNESINTSKINSLFSDTIKPWYQRLDEYLLNLTGLNIEDENNSKFSIAICFWSDVPRFYKDLKKFEKLKYKNFELIIITDKEIKLPKLSFPTKIISTVKKKTTLSEKRDLAIGASKGDFIAYIDDDAYPDPSWLTKALLDFKDPRVGAVGGPNMTPPEDPFWSKVSGFILESYCTSGEAQYRFVPTRKMIVPELQGVNLIIRKSVLTKIGGFRSRLYSGDDSKVCSNIRSAGYEIIYDPDVRVFHHRRAFPLGFLKQIKTYGLHRGFFVKKYPETLSPMYYLPAILAVSFFIGVLLSVFIPQVRIVFIGSFIIFLLIGSLSILKRAGTLNSIIAAFGIILTHITYGVFFLKGLTLKNLSK